MSESVSAMYKRYLLGGEVFRCVTEGETLQVNRKII